MQMQLLSNDTTGDQGKIIHTFRGVNTESGKIHSEITWIFVAPYYSPRCTEGRSFGLGLRSWLGPAHFLT